MLYPETLLMLHPMKYAATFRAGDFLAVQVFLMGDGKEQTPPRFEDPEDFGQSPRSLFRLKVLQYFYQKDKVGFLVAKGEGAQIPHLSPLETGMAAEVLLNQLDRMWRRVQSLNGEAQVQKVRYQIARAATQIHDQAF